MAEITDKEIPEHTVPASFERQCIRVKLNGVGGQYPDAVIKKGDVIRAAFGKNTGALQELQDTYKVTRDPKPGCRIVVYATLKFDDEYIQPTE